MTKYISRSSVFLIALILDLIWHFAFMKLKTKTDKKKFLMIFYPFVHLKDIKKVDVTDYGFVDGWGIRLWTKYGTIYNVKGSTGLFIQTNDNKRFLIGTQRKEKLDKVLSNCE